MTNPSSMSRSKVVRLIHEYDLSDIGDELEERWTRSENRRGLRQLAEYFNGQLLEATLATADTDPLKGEIENTYRLLTDEEISSGVQTETRNQLARDGVDVDKLEQDFVSKQAIHTYLTKVRQVNPPDTTPTSADQRDQTTETIQRLKHRLITVTERALTNLTNTNRLTLGEFTVLVNVRVLCTDCGTQFPVTDLLAAGTCNCESD